jgi:hypothetical protein
MDVYERADAGSRPPLLPSDETAAPLFTGPPPR